VKILKTIFIGLVLTVTAQASLVCPSFADDKIIIIPSSGPFDKDTIEDS